MKMKHWVYLSEGSSPCSKKETQTAEYCVHQQKMETQTVEPLIVDQGNQTLADKPLDTACLCTMLYRIFY